MLNRILNRLTSAGTAQARRGTSRRATASRGRSATSTGVRRGVGRRSRQPVPAQSIVSRLLGRR